MVETVNALSYRPIRVTQFHAPLKKGNTEICPGCGEAYPTTQGTQCLTCQGQGYYELQQ